MSSGPDATPAGYLAGRGIADITGESAGCGMLGYGKASQRTAGIHTRLRSRAFVIVDRVTSARVLLSINELPMIFDSVHREVLRRLGDRFGGLYHEQNVMLTATHTHCGPGGYSYYRLYNSNTGGFRPLTFAAIVDGIVEAAARAHADLAPAALTLGHAELRDASINRSRVAFDRNPEADRAFFPDALDPQTTAVGIWRHGELVGAVNWFATHGTSMTNRNRLISSDNKGYAAYHSERLVRGVDYLAEEPPSFIGAFAQTNAGDMTPNLNLRPGSGPTEDQFENTRIIGERQAEAAAVALGVGGPFAGPVDARLTYVDLARVTVGGVFTGDGRTHRTSDGFGGAAALAGTDEGPAFRLFRQGRNPAVDWLSRQVWYRLSPRVRDAQAPKGLVVPGGWLNRLVPLAQERVPVQLIRLGGLYLIGIPAEATIVAGLRLRRTVAAIVGADVRDVLVAGYANTYAHYVTTPEEYDAQRYEGGSTLFGRWELPALQQTVAGLATAMRDGRPSERGDVPPVLSAPRAARTRAAGGDRPPGGRRLGDVLVGPWPSYRSGDVVRVVFAGAHPGNDVRRGRSFLEVQRAAGDDGPWLRVADDGDWSTKLRCSRAGRATSEIVITWAIPAQAPAGRYRICYHGDARDGAGGLRPVEGVTSEFMLW
ncbi:MAG TPA: neutral/alkaline non-lysosomal ceramidase N-terminal domain-containing protein [Acidimicrobiales bacterium]